MIVRGCCTGLANSAAEKCAAHGCGHGSRLSTEPSTFGLGVFAHSPLPRPLGGGGGTRESQNGAQLSRSSRTRYGLAIIGLWLEIPKLCGFPAIRTRLAFVDDLDHAERHKCAC